LCLLAVNFTSAFAGSPDSKSSVYGEWIPPDQDAIIRIEPCHQNTMSLCATLIKHAYSSLSTADAQNPNGTLKDRPLIGINILSNLKPNNRKNWRGGKLYDPRTGKSYFAKLKLLGQDKIQISGCIGPGLCKGYVWHRANLNAELMPSNGAFLSEFTASFDKTTSTNDQLM